MKINTSFLCLICVLVTSTVCAQQDTLHQDYSNYYGVSLSLGKGNDNYGFSNINFFLQRKNNYVSLGMSGITKPEFIFKNDEPNPTTNSLDLILGKSITFNRYLKFHLGAGVSYVEDISRGAFLYNTCKSMFCIVDRNVYETIDRKTIGLPIEFKANFYLDRTAALTLGLTGNINSVKSFYGIYAGVVVGRLRDRVVRQKQP